MTITIKRLRVLIVALACLLLAVVSGFLVYARYRVRHIGKDLPAKLGMNIQRTANGFTYSQSQKGHTLFTIHASRLVQFSSDGHATLHDVAITLYGPPGTNREDHVYGSDFDYDQKNGIASAKGEVQIDLESPEGQGEGEEEAERGTIHVKARGMVFNQKTGIASTDQFVEFYLPKAAGQAVGASYDSKQGVLILDRQVELTSSDNGEPAIVHAAHAQLLRDSRQAFLLDAEAEFRNTHSKADQAIVYFRKDGSAEKIDARGNVHLITDSGAESVCQTTTIHLDAKSQPLQALMGGGINFTDHDPLRTMHGNAVEGTLDFGANSTLKHAQFRNAVSFVEQQKLVDDPNGSTTRQIQATKLDVDFAPGPDKSAVAQKALATGSAVATFRSIPSKGSEQNTVVSGDQLLATLEGGRTVRQLDGTGNTKIVDTAKDGTVNTTSGDTLHMTFANMAKAHAETQRQKRAAQKDHDMENAGIETAIQEGHVVLTQVPPKSKKDASVLHASALRAEYHAADQVVHLIGNPHVNNGEIDLTAQVIDYHRDSGDATATGSVKATDLQTNGKQQAQGAMLGGQGLTHILADQAELHHASGDSIFRGNARMWQQTGNMVSAPVLVLSQSQQTLKAYGEAGEIAPVNTAIASAMGSKKQQGVVRVRSRMLVYSDKERRGDFTGDVVAIAPDGTIRADRAQFFLEPAEKKPSGSTQQSQQSQIEKIVATGHVLLTQPGRKGEGEQLVYTAADGRYVLTGTSSNPPYIVDAAQGTTTGAALIFNDQDDSVEVSGGASAAVTRTHTRK
ncbi:MAG: LPS export ABC transporter periplasmic protein LptC [Acidobacterium ailaaui]|nr:LPS export ABC transporter periplasmic protein LptC [Pseudacidobacterium ailaaui]MCL6463736.1 LPS export ABC transporter periplasmic protein LptC [Pseudacidobacterium ailaaui]